jgi:hypothetical protein
MERRIRAAPNSRSRKDILEPSGRHELYSRFFFRGFRGAQKGVCGELNLRQEGCWRWVGNMHELISIERQRLSDG